MQRFTFEIFLCAQWAHWWVLYVPSGDFMCPSHNWNLDISKRSQDICTTWKPFSLLQSFPMIPNTWQFDQYEDVFLQIIIYVSKRGNVPTGCTTSHIMCFFITIMRPGRKGAGNVNPWSGNINFFPMTETQFLQKRGVWKLTSSTWLSWCFLQVME